MYIRTKVTYSADAVNIREYNVDEILTSEEKKQFKKIYNKRKNSEQLTGIEAEEFYSLFDKILDNCEDYEEWNEDTYLYDLVDEEFQEIV